LRPGFAKRRPACHIAPIAENVEKCGGTPIPCEPGCSFQPQHWGAVALREVRAVALTLLPKGGRVSRCGKKRRHQSTSEARLCRTSPAKCGLAEPRYRRGCYHPCARNSAQIPEKLHEVFDVAVRTLAACHIR